MDTKITIDNEGFVAALTACGATNVKIPTQKDMENNDEIIFDLNGKSFLISSARTGNIQKGSYLNFTSLLSESIPKNAEEAMSVLYTDYPFIELGDEAG